MRSALLVALAFACTVCSHHPFADAPASGVVYCDQHGIALQSTPGGALRYYEFKRRKR
jgi:hypothetical protein